MLRLQADHLKWWVTHHGFVRCQRQAVSPFKLSIIWVFPQSQEHKFNNHFLSAYECQTALAVGDNRRATERSA
jgi:hypothetical protein